MRSDSNSIVQQNTVPSVLKNHETRLGVMEASDGSNDWIAVGASQLYPNPDQPNVNTFKNGWNVVAGEGPLEYKRFLNWLHFRGGFDGGEDGTVVFILPELHRPEFNQPMLLPLADGAGIGYVLIVAATGEVFYLGAFLGSPGTGAITEIINTDGFIAIGNPTGPIVDLEFNAAGLSTVAVTSIDGGGGQMTGDVTFSAGTGISLNQVDPNVEIDNTGVVAIDVGTEILTGAVTFSAGSGISLAVIGGDEVEITATGSGSGTISDITSTGGSIDVTDPTGPTTNLEVDLTWLAANAVTEIDVGTEILFGAVTFSAGSGIALAVIGGTEVEISATGSGSGLQFDTEPQVGDWLDVETTTVDGFGHGMTFHNAKGLFLTGTETGLPALGITGIYVGGASGQGESIEVDTVDGQAFGFGVTATASGLGDALGADVETTTQDGASAAINISAQALGAGGASAINANAFASDAVAATGADIEAANVGSGDAIGLTTSGQSADGLSRAALFSAGSTGIGDVTVVEIAAVDDGGSGTIVELLVRDKTGAPIFRIDDDGSVHIKTGSAIVADL